MTREEEKQYIKETEIHRDLVGYYIDLICEKLQERKRKHDLSKLQEPEKTGFMNATKKLKGLTYGSKEYDKQMDELRETIDHHYKNNDHHCEFFENGFDDMGLLPIIECLADWAAATKRNKDGSLEKSIQINKNKKLGFDDKYARLFEITRKDLGIK